MPKRPVIVWYRNDLRVADHEPLVRAAESNHPVLPLYVFDPRTFGTLPLGFRRTGPHRSKFLLDSLASLRAALNERGATLSVLKGYPELVIPEFVRKYGAHTLYVQSDRTYTEYQIKLAVINALKAEHCAVEAFWGNTLVHIEDLPFRLEEMPDVFTDFRRAVERSSPIRACFQPPSHLQTLPDVEEGDIPTMPQLKFLEPKYESRSAFIFKGGEEHGKARLEHYFWRSGAIETYKETRNGLIGSDYSSKFSPWMAAGSLTPRQVYHEVKKYESEKPRNDSSYWLVFELLWRDYFKFLFIKYPKQLFMEQGLRKEPDNQRELEYDSQRKELFLRWVNGSTGFPFIDANMRELAATGFISNRGRKVVASFLVKEMLLPWTWGAQYFESQLIDFDPASNYGNWAYVSGAGTDPRQDRYFDLEAQARKYDGEGRHAKLWIPELQGVPGELAHKVQQLTNEQMERFNIRIGKDYPEPVIDLGNQLSMKLR